MFNSIRKSLIAGFSIILILIIASNIYNMYIFSTIKNHVTDMRENIIVSFKYTSDMKSDVIQVSQFFGDVSVTSKNDGLSGAEKYYNEAKTNLKNFKTINPQFSMELDKLDDEIDKMYKTGSDMANAYLTSGTGKGNELMTEFDKQVESLYSSVADLQQRTESFMDDRLLTIEQNMSMDQNISIALSALTVLLAILIALFLSNRISKPINNLLEIFRDMEKGQGDLTRRIAVKTKDELARMAQSFNVFMDGLEKMVMNIKRNSTIVSKGSEFLSDGAASVAVGFAEINDHMSKAAEDSQKINNAINQITESVSEIAKASQASASDAQNISLEADKINMLAQESGKLALDTKLKMEATEEISLETVTVAERLGNEAQEIGKIIDTIKAITDQTNLLALNAAIEAARAGEHGRGFGVVAEEIRKLAENNNQSTKMIEAMIKNIQEMIENTIVATEGVGGNIKKGREMVEGVYQQLQHIIDGVSHINDSIQNIAAGTEEQSASTEELSATMEAINDSNAAINSAMQEVSASISTQTETFMGLNTTARDLNSSSVQLNDLVSRFKLRIDK